MRVFLAGGSGVIGSRLVPALLSQAHEVFATTRHAENVPFLQQLGAIALCVDVYDAPHLSAVVSDSAPDLIMHQLTDLSDFDLDANIQSIGWPDGAYNIVDDDPAAGTQRVPIFARGLGAPTPPSGPLLPGEFLRRGASNGKARAMGWTPAHPTWRGEFPTRDWGA